MRLLGVLQRSARQSHALTFLKEQWRSRIRMRHALLMEIGKARAASLDYHFPSERCHHEPQTLLKSLAQSDDPKCACQIFLCDLEYLVIANPAGADSEDKSALQILTMRRHSNKIFHA